jgi:SOS-response transcriptional repressor LexA
VASGAPLLNGLRGAGLASRREFAREFRLSTPPELVGDGALYERWGFERFHMQLCSRKGRYNHMIQLTTENNNRDLQCYLQPLFVPSRVMKTPLFAARLKELRERVTTPSGILISQSDLARAIGVTPQAVQKWEAGLSVPREAKRKQIAAALSTNVRELIEGTELEEHTDPATTKDVGRGIVFPSRVKDDPKSKGGLPLISWVQAATWETKMGNLRPDEVQDWLLCPFEHGPGSFVLEVSGESNYAPGAPKSYAPGDFIYVDPTREPVNRCMVVVRIDGEERAQLKQLLMDEGGPRLLKSLNPNWPSPIAPFADHMRIIGVVIGKWVAE